MTPCLVVFCVAIQVLDTFQMVAKAVSFTEPRFCLGDCCVHVVSFSEIVRVTILGSEGICIGLGFSLLTTSPKCSPFDWRSLRHYPRFFRYVVLLSSGEVVLCADPGGPCSGPSNLGIIFVLSIYHVEHSCSAFVASFSSPLDALAVSSPFGSVSGADTLLTTQAYIFWRSLLSS